MKVLLNRKFFLGGILYEPVQSGTVLPDKIGDRPLVLFTQKAKDDLAKKMAEQGADFDESKAPIILPRDVKEWTEELAKKWSPRDIPLIKGHPQLGEQVPLSALTPGLSRAEQEANIKRDLPKTLADKADKEKELLDSPAVGKK